MKNKKGMFGAFIGILLVVLILVSLVLLSLGYDADKEYKEICSKLNMSFIKISRNLFTADKIICFDNLTMEIKIIP